MPIVTIVYGLLLVAVGVGGYFGTGAEHKTALIPAAIGIIALILGVLARNEKLLKHTMHAAAVLALLAIGGTFRGMIAGFKALGGAELARPLPAILAQSFTCVLSIIFLALCINSFVVVRRARAREAAAAANSKS